METTLLLVKPDAVAKGICGNIISRFEQRGFKIIGMKMLQMSETMAKTHYGEHQDKPFFTSLVSFITAGPLVAIAVSGENVISLSRSMIGSTNPLNASAGTIRGDFATNTQSNMIHGSDSPDSARRELALFFTDAELYNS